MSRPRLILASASPRRSALLQQLHIAHRVQPVDIDEAQRPGEAPASYVQRLATTKAETLWRQLPPDQRLPVLGADTAVVVEGAIYGKPLDRADGLRMLAALAGRTHEVYTAVSLRHEAGLDSRLSISEVAFRELSEKERMAYWDSGEPRDKAGGYAVQGLAAAFIIRIAGSYSGVMGLPLAETAELLGRIGWLIRPVS